MTDYAGAVAAIKQRVKDNWLTTPIAFQNETPDRQPWPPVDQNGSPTPWVYFEIIANPTIGNNQPHTLGTPNNHDWRVIGLISAHVFVPINSGTDLAFQHAVAIGEIFRTQVLYNSAPPDHVRTWGPRIDGGGSSDDDGNWFRVTMTVPFEYWHRG